MLALYCCLVTVASFWVPCVYGLSSLEVQGQQCHALLANSPEEMEECVEEPSWNPPEVEMAHECEGAVQRAFLPTNALMV